MIFLPADKVKMGYKLSGIETISLHLRVVSNSISRERERERDCRLLKGSSKSYDYTMRIDCRDLIFNIYPSVLNYKQNYSLQNLRRKIMASAFIMISYAISNCQKVKE